MPEQNSHQNQSPDQSKQKGPANILRSRDNTVAIYTVLSIILEIRKTHGLEAMLEYMEKYVDRIGNRNPDLCNAVKRALSLLNIDKIYDEVANSPAC